MISNIPEKLNNIRRKLIKIIIHENNTKKYLEGNAGRDAAEIRRVECGKWFYLKRKCLVKNRKKMKNKKEGE